MAVGMRYDNILAVVMNDKKITIFCFYTEGSEVYRSDHVKEFPLSCY